MDLNDTPMATLEEKEVIEEVSGIEIEILNEESVLDVIAGPEYVVTDSAEEMFALLDDYYERTSNHFVRVQQDKSFRTPLKEYQFMSHKVLWKELPSASAHLAMEFDGVPYMIIGCHMLACQYGHDRNVMKRIKYQQMKESGEIKVKGERHLNVPTKKSGCPAKVLIKRIVKFPQHKIGRNTSWLRTVQARKLKSRLKVNLRDVEKKEMYLGIFPAVSDHQFHETVCGNKEPVDRRLKIMAQELALAKVPVTDILKQLEQHVENELFFQQTLPNKQRRRFYPSRRDVQNFIHDIRTFAYLSQEQVNELKEYFDKLQENDEERAIYFHTSESDHSSNQEHVVKDEKRKKFDPLEISEFVFFYQTSHQRRLLSRYGNIVYIVEILPNENAKKAMTLRMFLMVLKTNVNHHTVGVFLFNKHNPHALKETLNICKQSNSSCWIPKIIVIDRSKELLEVVNEVFPDCDYYFNFHSCLREWKKFLKRPINGLFDQADEIVTYLKNMQICLCKDELSNAAVLLEQSNEWKCSETLREWFQNEWLPTAERWVKEYRVEELSLIDEHLIANHLTKYEELLSNFTRNIKEGFVGLVHVLTSTFPQQNYQSYVDENKIIYEECLQIRNLHPSFELCYGLPFPLLRHLSPALKILNTDRYLVQQSSFGQFNVIVNKNESYSVSFGTSLAFPNCTCDVWQQNKLSPCLHMLMIFKDMEGWKYDSLSPLYRSNILLQLDYSCLASERQDGIPHSIDKCSIFHDKYDDIDHVENLLISLKRCEKLFLDKNKLQEMTSELQILCNKYEKEKCKNTFINSKGNKLVALSPLSRKNISTSASSNVENDSKKMTKPLIKEYTSSTDILSSVNELEEPLHNDLSRKSENILKRKEVTDIIVGVMDSNDK